MGPQRTKNRRHPSQPQTHHLQQPAQQHQAPLTDYDTDQYYPSDIPGSHQFQPQSLPPPPTGPPRSTADLNLSVLRRYNPSIHSIIALAPYAVLYVFVPETQKWDKCNIEGTLFVCGLEDDPDLPGAQRFVAVVLNRRGLDNFATLLDKSHDVEVTDEYVILQVHGDLTIEDGNEEDQAQPGVKIYGLWIFSEGGTSTADIRRQVAAVIKECAATAETSRVAAEEAMRLAQAASPNYHQDQHTEEPVSAPMGRQLSLRELFGQQREQDAGFSVHDHHSPQAKAAMPQFQAFQQPLQQQQPPPPPQQPPMFMNNPDTAFFRGNSPYRAAMERRPGQNSAFGHVAQAASNGPLAGGPELLADLFRHASNQGR